MKLFHDLVQLMLSLVSKLTEINRIHQLYEDFEFDRVVSKETVVYSVVFLIYAIFFCELVPIKHVDVVRWSLVVGVNDFDQRQLISRNLCPL